MRSVGRARTPKQLYAAVSLQVLAADLLVFWTVAWHDWTNTDQDIGWHDPYPGFGRDANAIMGMALLAAFFAIFGALLALISLDRIRLPRRVGYWVALTVIAVGPVEATMGLVAFAAAFYRGGQFGP